MAVSQALNLYEEVVQHLANESTVRIKWTSTQTGESWNGYTRTAKYYVSINGGAETEYTVSYTLPQNSTSTILNTTIKVPHKNDGTGTVKVRTWMDTGISADVVELNKTITLTTIARASTISRVRANQKLGETCFVEWTSYSASFYFKLKFTLGNFSETTEAIPATKTRYSDYTIPLEVANQLPNAKEGVMTVSLYTYSNASCTNQVGSASSLGFLVIVPENESTKPTVSMSLSPSSDLPSPYNSLYLQGHSKVKATLGFSTKCGATVSASSITINNINYESPYESGFLSQTGTVSVKATVKDSRGFYGTNYKDIEVIPYSKPYITAKSGESSIIAARCDASANLSESGTYLKIKAKVVYSKVISGGVQKNYAEIKYRYRKEGGSFSAWQTILDCKANNSDEVITPPLLSGALDIKSNYQVQIVASDDLYDSEPITIAIPSDAVYMHRPSGGKSMGLGGYSSGDGKLDLYWKLMAREGLSVIDSNGVEIALDSTMPLPRDQVVAGFDPNNLENGIYAVTNSKPLKSGDTVIMYNGVLIQMTANIGGNVKIQLALTSDENKNPYYRVHWYGNWGNWRSFKL